MQELQEQIPVKTKSCAIIAVIHELSGLVCYRHDSFVYFLFSSVKAGLVNIILDCQKNLPAGVTKNDLSQRHESRQGNLQLFSQIIQMKSDLSEIHIRPRKRYTTLDGAGAITVLLLMLFPVL